MILQLRQRHRRVFALLGVLLPLAFIAGIALRRTIPPAAALPSGLSTQTITFTATGHEWAGLFAKAPLIVRLFRDRASGALAAGFSAPKDFLKPDLLVYWSAAPPTNTDTLPPDARLLGAFVAEPLVLPAESTATEGHLILFSLANQELVDVSKPIRFEVP
jgi:hypothetical protein